MLFFLLYLFKNYNLEPYLSKLIRLASASETDSEINTTINTTYDIYADANSTDYSENMVIINIFNTLKNLLFYY